MNTLDTTLRFQEQALKLSGQRQQVVSSNIANADTPGFRAQEFDFASALQAAQSVQPGNAPVTTTHPMHIVPAASSNSAQVVESSAVQPSADGNTVDMDMQRAQFAESALQYQSAFTFLNSQIKTILSAVQG